jgi:hypothetical protein
MEYVQHLLVILAEVLSQHGLVDALHLDYVLGNSIGRVLVDEALGDVVSYGEFWLLVEHEDEELGLLIEFLVLVDVLQLVHQHPILVLFLGAPLVRGGDGVAVLDEVILHFEFKLRSPFLSFSADH